MTGRLGEEKRALSEADDLFKRKGDEYSGLEKTLNDMKYIMPEIEKTYNDLGRYLIYCILLRYFWINNSVNC